MVSFIASFAYVGCAHENLYAIFSCMRTAKSIVMNRNDFKSSNALSVRAIFCLQRCVYRYAPGSSAARDHFLLVLAACFDVYVSWTFGPWALFESGKMLLFVG